MGLFRKTPAQPSTAERTADQAAVERYEYLLRTAPPDTLEQVHVEAFEKLTPSQLDILFNRFTEHAETPAERPSDARPATLARTATRAEAQRPGTMTQLFGMNSAGFSGGYFGVSLLDTIAGYVIGSALVDAFFPTDFGSSSDTGTAAEANSQDNDPGNNDGYFLDGSGDLF